MKLIPTILTNSREELEKELDFFQGKTDWIQIDLIDGRFASQKTFPLEWLDKHQEKGFFWEIHLMVNNPFSWVEKCNFVMAHRVVGQIEKMDDQIDFIDRVESEAMEAGLAVDLATPITRLDKEALYRCSLVLLMAVKAGASGEKFDPGVLKKMEELQALKVDLAADFQIGVDGGVTKTIIPQLKEKRVDVIYSHNAIWSSLDKEKAFSQLKELAE